jgi:hypothetical protein
MILNDLNYIYKLIVLLFQIVLSLQVQVMAKEVWVFGTKEQVFTQVYKIENSWTIKHYLIDSGKASNKFVTP